MNTKEVLAIALKLFSIWVLVQTFWLSSNIVLSLATIEQWQGSPIPNWVYAAMVVGFVAIGVAIAWVLYKTSDSVLSRPPEKGDIEPSKQTQKYLLQLGGIYFVVTALVAFLPSISFLWAARPSHEPIPLHYFLRPFSYVLQLTIGLWLVVHSSWWLLLLNKLRGRA